MEQSEQCGPDLTKKFLDSIYVDDLTSGDSDIDRYVRVLCKVKAEV